MQALKGTEGILCNIVLTHTQQAEGRMAASRGMWCRKWSAQAQHTWEQGVAHVQLRQNAAKAPHVDLTAIRQAHDHLWAAVEAALHVGVHALIDEAAAAKVNDLDGGALRLHQQDILRLQVTVDQLVLSEEPAESRKAHNSSQLAQPRLCTHGSAQLH